MAHRQVERPAGAGRARGERYEWYEPPTSDLLEGSPVRLVSRAPRRLLAVVAAVGLAAVAAPVAAAPLRGSTPTVPDGPAAALAAPDGARFGEFVEATDTALVVSQPDGSTFRARLTDAEIGGALEADGYTVVQREDGWWHYAAGRDESGLEATSARVGLDAPPANLDRHAGRIASVWDDGQGGDVRTELLRQLQAASREASLQAAAEGGPRVFRFPVVLFATWYDPELGQTAPQFQDGNDVAHYQAILDGFGGNPTGTLTEFYFENSYGQFLVEVDVLAKPDGSPYVSTRSSLPGDEGRCYYGGIDPPEDPLDDLDALDTVIGAGGGGALGMAIELFNTTTLPLDHQFAKYDNDGDGSIDFMGIIHSGAEMAVTGDPCNTWSHAISISTFTSIAGTLLQGFGLPVPDTGFKLGLPVLGQAVTYDRLFTMPEFETRTGVLTIGVAAHEMAHALGEPDYYATDGSSSGSGDWDIMAGGSYGGTPSGSNPTWFNPATRVFQGWVTPTLVHDDVRDYALERRSSQPSAGYAVGTPNPNLVLVPTRWVNVGDTTEDDHTWTANDVHGLVKDGDKGYVIEGWYLELASRMPARSDAIHDGMTRESYFDRWVYGSGLLTWHFDYWRRSNVLFGQNGANNDPNRMQMDVEEWDFNDNTQEIALNMNRAEASDVAWDAATGITSGTHRPSPGVVVVEGDPQAEIAIPPGPVTPLTPYDFAFEVEDNPANRTMRVAITPGVGDCTLQLLSGPPGAERPETEVVDAGFVGAEETAIVSNPKPGRWVARIGDFAACLTASGSVSFDSPVDFDATGTADTWSNDTQEPTGWAFTNIRTGGAEGLSHGTDAGGAGTLTLDIVNLDGSTDVSPGVARPAIIAESGLAPVTVGSANPFSVRVVNNGSTDQAAVHVAVRRGSATGPVVASGDVSVPAYASAPFDFTFDPGQEGGYDLVTVVDPDDAIAEAIEGNNVQKASGWAGPADPSVLIVDDDGPGDTERVYAGALAALGIPYAIAERHVTAEQLGAYDAVIWVSTLDRSEGQLDEDDRAVIAGYLGDGGRLWLSSNRAIEALTLVDQAAFAATWFGVESVDIDSYYKPVQFRTEDILGDGELSLEVLPGRPFIDKYALAGGAVSLGVLDGSGTPADGEAILGARLEGDADGTAFQTVVSSFSLTQVSDLGAAIEMVGKIMEHFGVAGGQYTVSSEDPIVYHSQPRQTVSNVAVGVRAIVLGGTAGQPVRLFYRHHASGDYTPVAMVPRGNRGGYTGNIPAADVTPDGIDYYLKAGAASTFEPRIAEGGAVANAIAVFMPEGAAAPAPAPAPAPGPAPAPSGTQGSQRLPATGGESLALLAAAALLAALATRRLLQRSAQEMRG
jgi:M6 family metalloprotease-like protein